MDELVARISAQLLSRAETRSANGFGLPGSARVAGATATQGAGTPSSPAATTAPPDASALTPSTMIPRRLSRDETLARIAMQIETKTLPGVVAEVLAIAGSPHANLTDAVTVLRRDPVIAARVLHVANTAAYATARARISSIEDAVRNIGMGAIRDIAAAIGVFEAFPPDASDGFNSIRCWQHCVGVANLMANYYAHGALLASGVDAPVGPVTQLECRQTLGDPDPPALNVVNLRAEVLTLTHMLARVSAGDEARLSRPLLVRRETAIWYARHSSFARFDPLCAALELATQAVVFDRLPDKAELGDLAGVDALPAQVPLGTTAREYPLRLSDLADWTSQLSA